jgi:hypothetical protein
MPFLVFSLATNCKLQVTKSLLDSCLVNYHISWQEVLKPNFFFEIFKVRFFVERDLGHVTKVTPDLDATKLNRRLELQRFKILLQVITSDLKKQNNIES